MQQRTDGDCMCFMCKSGNHSWLSQADADKCCNGFRRQLLIYPKASECDSFHGWFGYKWVPNT